LKSTAVDNKKTRRAGLRILFHYIFMPFVACVIGYRSMYCSFYNNLYSFL